MPYAHTAHAQNLHTGQHALTPANTRICSVATAVSEKWRSRAFFKCVLLAGFHWCSQPLRAHLKREMLPVCVCVCRLVLLPLKEQVKALVWHGSLVAYHNRKDRQRTEGRCADKNKELEKAKVFDELDVLIVP